MNFNKFAIVGFSILSLVAMAGCDDSASDDPLSGTWSNSNCYGLPSRPADIESCTTELSFGDDLNIELTAERLSLSATATTPGCTSTRLITGQQWSTEHVADTFTVTGKGSTTLERTSCVNESDNMEPTTTSDVIIPDGDTTYTLSGDTLSVKSGLLAGTYTR